MFQGDPRPRKSHDRLTSAGDTSLDEIYVEYVVLSDLIFTGTLPTYFETYELPRNVLFLFNYVVGEIGLFIEVALSSLRQPGIVPFWNFLRKVEIVEFSIHSLIK